MLQLDAKLLKDLINRKVSLEDIEAQEKTCALPKLDGDVAFELGMFLRDNVKEMYPDASVAIDITLANNHCLFRTMINNETSPVNDDWLRRKRNTCVKFQHSTMYMGTKKADKTPEERFFISSIEYAFHGGAVPIYLTNTSFPVACLTISGLRQEEDHLLAVVAINEFAKRMTEVDLNLD
ncbi:hypothetical protein Kpol_1053p47 [Vanderwaltozyma polyspora DSM 70294]|uniref:Uncharacterized protein n=1 Tax=Vanderwaltozyma polyspora (strain ATCC 22028 / DSM 70294 / BCRC 21397 / CBS 2163 / NBRC 10782 / NRRL Y-8283 / UCD 57-17) TaxID=436907 RepID=A7TN91_VANPO|nr:uncharacterized protein Kpol_1053p47 [Vanderwaltozyma polyspora DSM 70294]EDO16309.1 hypothetical protein Kpol_1053p47 [Vanderwaltozyma polyspora DSM 70294]